VKEHPHEGNRNFDAPRRTANTDREFLSTILSTCTPRSRAGLPTPRLHLDTGNICWEWVARLTIRADPRPTVVEAAMADETVTTATTETTFNPSTTAATEDAPMETASAAEQADPLTPHAEAAEQAL